VAEEGGHQAGEAEPEGGVGVAEVRLGRPVQGREPFLPRAPGPGGAVPQVRISAPSITQ
jgi:hypothetical protein